MNRVILMGRLTRDPEVRYSQGDNSTAIARYTIAIDRIPTKNQENPGADFVGCVAFGKNGEFAEKHLKKGTKILVEGRIQTGSYTNKDGAKIYTTDVIVERHEFAESKSSSNQERDSYYDDMASGAAPQTDNDGFMNIPDGIDEELPFA